MVTRARARTLTARTGGGGGGEPQGGEERAQSASRAHTLGGGHIEPGKIADFVWVDRNWLEVDPAEVGNTRILGTCINGEWCYLEKPRQ